MVGLSGETVGERMSGRDGELDGKLKKALHQNKTKVEKGQVTPHVRSLSCSNLMSFMLTLTPSENGK